MTAKDSISTLQATAAMLLPGMKTRPLAAGCRHPRSRVFRKPRGARHRRWRDHRPAESGTESRRGSGEREGAAQCIRPPERKEPLAAASLLACASPARARFRGSHPSVPFRSATSSLQRRVSPAQSAVCCFRAAIGCRRRAAWSRASVPVRRVASPMSSAAPPASSGAAPMSSATAPLISTRAPSTKASVPSSRATAPSRKPGNPDRSSTAPSSRASDPVRGAAGPSTGVATQSTSVAAPPAIEPNALSWKGKLALGNRDSHRESCGSGREYRIPVTNAVAEGANPRWRVTNSLPRVDCRVATVACERGLLSKRALTVTNPRRTIRCGRSPAT